MEAPRWAVIESLYHAALAMEPGKRSSYIAEACAADPELQSELESLLRCDEGELKDPVADWVDLRKLLEHVALPPTFESGQSAIASIGPYQLLQLIGEGGMGEVWLAEQKQPVRRRVALKLIKVGMDTREVMGRFESERQALALMDHPAVAKVFDAGSTPSGRPYFVMEYVSGIAITTYCDKHKLSTRERLELFIRVCEGVQHAHQKAIIHRDLKPSNILVTEVDGKPMPKIIDFGVAKAISQPLTAGTMLTRVGSVVGTPEYMSPEQADSSGEDIDTRTDVYSLGVILYQLLAGVLPLELENLSFDAVLRKLREEDPARPSTKVRALREESRVTAQNRRTEPKTLFNQLSGDLDAITLKALEKDRSRRYGTPSELAADIGLYLRDQPIAARPASVGYRARKYIRRHRIGVAVAAAFILLLAAFAITEALQIRRVIQEHNRADTEAATAKAVNDFLENDLLAQASAGVQARPGTKPDPDLKVRTALDRAAVRIAGKFNTQPLVEASIRETIGKTYTDLGLYPEGERQLDRALQLRLRVLGKHHKDTLTTMNDLGELYLNEGKYARAEPLLSNAFAERQRLLGHEHPDTLSTMNTLAVLYWREGKYPQAESLFTKVLNSYLRVLGQERPDTVRVMNDLAVVYLNQNKSAQAEPLLTKALNVHLHVLGPEHPDTLIDMDNLGQLRFKQGKYAEAESLFSKVLAVRERVLGQEHPDTLMSMNNVAAAYLYDGRYAEAEPLCTKALELQRRVLGEKHPRTLISMNNLAFYYRNLGRYAQAEALNIEVLALQRRALGEEHPSTLLSMHNLATLYRDEGKYAEAEPLFIKVLEVRRRLLGTEHPDTLASMYGLALLYRDQGRYVQAEQLHVEVIELQRRVLGEEHPTALASLNDLAFLYLYQHNYSAAEGVLREALNSYQKSMVERWGRYSCQSLLGTILAGQKRYAEAEALLLSGYQGMLQREASIPADNRFKLRKAEEWILQLYHDWGKPEKAAEWRKK